MKRHLIPSNSSQFLNLKVTIAVTSTTNRKKMCPPLQNFLWQRPIESFFKMAAAVEDLQSIAGTINLSLTFQVVLIHRWTAASTDKMTLVYSLLDTIENLQIEN
jgi:hypothetical protein